MFARAAVGRLGPVVAVRAMSTASMRTAGATTRTATSSAFAAAAAAAAVTVAAGGFFYARGDKVESEKIAKATAGTHGTLKERSFIMIKPDAVQRGLIADIIGRFEKKGFKLVALKMLTPSKDLVAKHYDDLKTKPFFNGLVQYMTAGTPVVAMVWEGQDVIKTARKMLGATKPSDAEPGTIRFDLFLTVGRNGIHASDSFESASDEIKLWFTDAEISDWDPKLFEWVNETK